MQEEVTLERGFGVLAGRFVQDGLEAHGVEVIGRDEVERFEGGDERVKSVALRSGRSVPADVVVAGVGALPDVTLAKRAGLQIGELGGVKCSARLETSAPGVYAAGDMCEYESVVHDRPMRIEHEDVAARQGTTAARSMLGSSEPHRDVPYFFSDLSDWASLKYVGPALAWDTELVRGSRENGAFSVWYLHGERVVAALSAGRPEDLEHARRMIVARTPLADGAHAALCDSGADLASI